MAIIEDVSSHLTTKVAAPADITTSHPAAHVHDKTVSAKLPAAPTDWTGTGLAKETGGHLEETADHVHSIDGKLPSAASSAALTNVSSSASSVTVLAANASRLGATVYNDSTAVLYLKLGTTASATSFTIKLSGGDYYEVPFWYTGRIDGIWASADGAARVTELTA